jgi:cell division septum initiation protein DivIVA
MRRLAIVIALALLAREAPAQGARLRQTPPAGQNAPRRQQLEARLRQGLWRITKNRVGLTDEQMTKLAQTSRPFDAERRRLAAQERDERLALRGEILAGPNADQQRIATSLDRVLDIQRRRAQMQIDEQRALGAFMTPLQRAKYAALQEQLRRRAETLRRQRVGAPPDPPLDTLR